ncbi:AraC family transcriptional regulator [Marivirga sp. S37H4]|uniref:AraC family transcriptional regulator n=1 Tax=Marivirga aurantiaca TaxID=2802615 RepID=A0A934WY82_9BACT|nr:helix-turn-helix domain-containing protein [Marivirga aurantiaca]MBK6265101.1 AraC family transcriptional regulator [Marivirga aurantiaca]
MNYQTYIPHFDLQSLVKCFWTLEVPAESNSEKQRIVPDGCIEMAFILGDNIKRFTSETDFIIQPRAMVLGQTIEPFYIQPVGYVNTFAIRFYPYGFANFVNTPIKNLANKETPIAELFGQSTANELEQAIIHETGTQERIKVIEKFLLNKLRDKATIDNIVKSTIDTLLSTNGSMPIHTILKENLSKRRQLERNFLKHIGISPKQLGKVIRLQTALKLLLNQKTETFTQIAYESEYYDQNHFIKDFKEFTGTTPKYFLADDTLALSSLFYGKD